MELAAVVVVPDNQDCSEICSQVPKPQLLAPLSSGFHGQLQSSIFPILGNDVLRTWTERIHQLGVQSLWLASSKDERTDLSVFGLLKQGVERLLMIKLKSYAELDLGDLVRFHCWRRNSVTEVHDAKGQLGVCVLDQLALPKTNEGPDCQHAGFERSAYPFHGYAKRIFSARERQELVGDALTGACAMRPFGNEIREQVWAGKDVRLADSVRLMGPSYIGDHAIVRAGATIGPFASVERDCVVDCGTTVEQSSILPATYLAPGLLFRNAAVDGAILQDLRSGAIADLTPAGLASRMPEFTPSRNFDDRPSEGSTVEAYPWATATSTELQRMQA